MTGPDTSRSTPHPEAAPARIAVAGNPNAGKSTLINSLVGTRLHVGNWPGVTVEKKEAFFERNGERIALVDLPGTYSLSPYTQEEVVARDYLVGERPDVIIDVVDATNLERNLYLTVQILELGIPVVIALNIYDEAQKMGYQINLETMERAMHCMGLHGKSFIPMLLGFGCSVPAIYATRTLENPRDKAMTALLVSLMSCGVRLPVDVLFTAAILFACSAVGAGVFRSPALFFSQVRMDIWRSEMALLCQ